MYICIYAQNIARTRLVGLNTGDIWGWIILCGEGGGPVHCRMFGRIPDSYPVMPLPDVPRAKSPQEPLHYRDNTPKYQ